MHGAVAGMHLSWELLKTLVHLNMLAVLVKQEFATHVKHGMHAVDTIRWVLLEREP